MSWCITLADKRTKKGKFPTQVAKGDVPDLMMLGMVPLQTSKKHRDNLAPELQRSAGGLMRRGWHNSSWQWIYSGCTAGESILGELPELS